LWKREFLSDTESVFDQKGNTKKSQAEEEKDVLLKAISRLKVENDF